MTDLRQAAMLALEALEGVYLSLQLPDLLKVVGPITALKAALEQPEQVDCPECKAAVLYECVACSSNNYPPKPQQEPVAWMVKLGDVTCFQHHADSKHASVPLYTTPPAVEPEPMRLYVEDFASRCGWEKDSGEGAFEYVQRKSYAQGLEDATPPAAQPEQVDCPRCGHVCSQRPWVGLTDEEIWEIHDRCIPHTEGYVFPVDFARAIEAAHNIKEQP